MNHKAMLYTYENDEEVIVSSRDFRSPAMAENYIMANLGTSINGKTITSGRLFDRVDDIVWAFSEYYEV